MLKVHDLKVSYGRAEVVRGVSFQIGRGEVVTLIGANGAGKTTTLKALCGLVPPGGGTVVFNGEEIQGRSAHGIVARGITMVPEGRQLFPWSSVRDNLVIGAFRGAARRDYRARLEQVVEIFPRLGERLGQTAGSLSGGEQQMVAIGRGLMAAPQLLILDEPSLGLSPLLVEQMFETIRRVVEKGLTVLIVEQNIFHTLDIADRGYVVENGRTVLTGTGAQLKQDPSVRKAYLGH